MKISSATPFGTPAVVLSTAVAAGSSGEALRTDDTIIAFDTTAPPAIAASSAVGSQNLASRRDHNHAGVVATAASITNDLTLTGGNVVVATAGKGIDFSAQSSPAAGMTGELLSRYEEGTWEPVLQDGDFSDKGQDTDFSEGTYTRIGRVVHVACRMRMNTLGSLTAGSAANLTGLPFTAVNTSELAFTLAVRGVTLNISAGQSLTCRVLYNTSYATIELWDLATGAGSALISEITASGTLVFTGHYEV